MKKVAVSELKVDAGSTMFGDLVSSGKVVRGGLHVSKPGEVAHADQERHVHEIEEVFIVLQGKGRLPLDDEVYDVKKGDVIIIEQRGGPAGCRVASHRVKPVERR